MSEFTDFSADAFEAAGEIFGTIAGTVLGKRLFGVLDGLQLDRSLAIGGESGSRPATYMVPLSQMSVFAKPIEDTLTNQILTIGTQDLQIIRVMVDECNATLFLEDPNRK